ncbi:hypothetical protein GmHk_14G041561 [Glycine max]|nr:hypothetical protein GmHk_14G041561 [Glycine max]
MRNFPPKPIPEFNPLPMTYEDLLPSLIANQIAVITPRRIYQPPFPKWYDPNATCTYHGNTPGHSIEKCLALKYKVQHLIDVGWLTFQEDRPNVKTNPLANHGGGAVNAIESDRPPRSKPLKDVATPRRCIFEALQKGGVIPHGGHKEDSCLLHPDELHNMETCLAVEELLQRMIDQGRLEVGDERREEQHICMQSADERNFGRPKPLVIYFTKDATPQKPQYPPATKPVPFPYQNSHAVPWRYTPPGEREEETTDVSSLSAKVTNITGLSGVTHSDRVFAPFDLPTQPANIKGKAKMVEEQNDKTTPTPNDDILVKGLPEKRDGCGKKEVSLEEASEFLRIIQQSEFKVIEQLNKTPARVSLLELLMSSEPHRALLVKVLNEAHESLETAFQSFEVVSIASVDSFSRQPCLSDAAVMVARVMFGNGYEPIMGLGKENGGITSLISTKGNRGKFGLGYKPTQADIKKGITGRKSGGQGSQLGQEVKGGPPCHISRSFISTGLAHEGQVVAICEDDSPSGSEFVRPCPPGFRLGNWQVEERLDIYATSIIFVDESLEGTNTWDPTIDFQEETNQTEDKEVEDPSLKKRFYQVKIKSLEVTSLRKLGQLMGQLQRQAFRKAYGKIWDLARVEVSMEPIASLSQYYDQPLRCFTFEDFQLVPTVKEFEEILGCPLGGRKPYLFSGFYPSTTRVAKVVKISAQELDRVKQNRNGVVGVPRKCLEERAKALANQGEWAFFY